MTFGFHPEAADEFAEAVAFYEGHDEGLGLDFAVDTDWFTARIEGDGK